MAESTSLVKVTLVDEDGELADAVYAEPLGCNRFRLVESGLLSPSGFGDVVEAVLHDEDGWVVRRTVRRGRFRVVCGLAPKAMISSAEFEEFGSALCKAGGQWQIDFGGMLRLHFPLRHCSHLVEQWERITRQYGPDSTSSHKPER